MTEFTKTKIAFSLALLGALFALQPFLPDFGEMGYEVFGILFRLKHVYALTAFMLAISVYFYAISLISETPFRWAEGAANTVYASSLAIPPLYLILFFSSLLSSYLSALFHIPVILDLLQVAAGVVGGALSVFVVNRYRNTLNREDRRRESVQIGSEQRTLFDRARQLSENGFFDLSLLEAWKAIELALKRSLLTRQIQLRRETPSVLVDTAVSEGVLPQSIAGELHTLRQHRNLAAHGTEAISHEAARKALDLASHVLALLEQYEPTKRVFIDSFDGDLVEWRIVRGRALRDVSEGLPAPSMKLVYSPEGTESVHNSMAVLRKFTQFRDGIIECDIRLSPGSVLDIIFRADVDDSALLMARLDARGGGFHDSMLVCPRGHWAGWHQIANSVHYTQPEIWHHVRVELRGNEIRLVKNGEVIIAILDTSYDRGEIGIFNELGDVWIDNFSISNWER